MSEDQIHGLSKIIGGKAQTEQGLEDRSDAITASLNTDSIEKDAERRRVFSNYKAILTILDIARPLHDENRASAIQYLLEQQVNSATDSRGRAGELLVKVGALLGIESNVMLNPDDKTSFENVLIEKATQSLELDILPTFISKNLDELSHINSSWGSDILMRSNLFGVELPNDLGTRTTAIQEALVPVSV